MYSLYSNGLVVKITNKSSVIFHEELKNIYGASYIIRIPNNFARTVRMGVLQGFIESSINATINPE